MRTPNVPVMPWTLNITRPCMLPTQWTKEGMLSQAIRPGESRKVRATASYLGHDKRGQHEAQRKVTGPCHLLPPAPSSRCDDWRLTFGTRHVQHTSQIGLLDVRQSVKSDWAQARIQLPSPWRTLGGQPRLRIGAYHSRGNIVRCRPGRFSSHNQQPPW